MHTLAFWQGMSAHAMGFDRGHNPYQAEYHAEWLRGWRRAAALAADDGKVGAPGNVRHRRAMPTRPGDEADLLLLR